ncbi:hypothetical protein B0H14DRAFT_2590859 [Mycena olivaceomarginata]|nr:hypothetical protein B0H14DRAFT_2590859 [Mycena olivaceomarginata]
MHPPVDHELWSRSRVTRAPVEPPSGHTGPNLPKKAKKTKKIGSNAKIFEVSDVEYPESLVIFNTFFVCACHFGPMINVFVIIVITACECGAQISEVESSVIAHVKRSSSAHPDASAAVPGVTAVTSPGFPHDFRIQGSRFKHFDPTNVSLHPILLTTRSLAAVFWYFLWLDQILSGSLIESQRNSDTTSVHLMGTVPPRKRPFAHRFFYLSRVLKIPKRCNSPTKPPRYSPPDTQTVYTLAVHREKPHLSALLRSAMVPPPPRYCWRLATVTLSHWKMRQRRISATTGCGTSAELATRRPLAFPAAAAGREGWMGTGLHYSVTLRLAQRCIGRSEQAGRLRRGGEGEVWHGPQGARTLELQGAVQDVPPAKQGSGGMEHHRGAARCGGIRGDVCTSQGWTERGRTHCLRLCGA